MKLYRIDQFELLHYREQEKSMKLCPVLLPLQAAAGLSRRAVDEDKPPCFSDGKNFRIVSVCH